MKLDIHNHILPESWPDLKKVHLSLFLSNFLISYYEQVQIYFLQKYGYGGGWVQLQKNPGCKSNEMDMMKGKIGNLRRNSKSQF